MNWTSHIEGNAELRGGRPVVKGTRLTVDFILERLADGWSLEQLLESYPQLTSEALQAVFAYSAGVLKEEALYALPRAG